MESSSSRRSLHHTSVCSTITGALFILLTTSFAAVGALKCLSCESAALYYDAATQSYTHNCTTVKRCEDPGPFGFTCTAAKWWNLETPVVFLDCFQRHERTPYFCLLSDGETCTCTNELCNAQLFDVKADIPRASELVFPEYTEAPSPPNVTSESTVPYKFRTAPKEGDEPSGKRPNNDMYFIWAIVIGTTICIALATSAIFALALKVRRNRSKGMCTVTSNTDSTSLDLGTEYSDTKGLNSTPPMSPSLYESNHMELVLEEVVGRGRFGAVWRAEWKLPDGKDVTVAVKVFYEFDSTSWNVEKELFNDPTVMLQHKNIIRFIKAEVRQISYPQPQKQYWLISQFYAKGSLHDYISQKTVDWEEFCRMACSTAAGVAHLHDDVFVEDPSMHKYPVAHRDLKSSNVLVKNDGSCVIADFGLAVRLDPRASEQELANSGQVGTPRYMPPEALESKINLRNIESFKQIDVYSLCLIIWELARRCTVFPGDAADHELPYTEQLQGRQPTVEVMRALVCKRQERPTIPAEWKDHEGMSIIADTISECWDEDPEARLTASCITRRLMQLPECDEEETDLLPTTDV